MLSRRNFKATLLRISIPLCTWPWRRERTLRRLWWLKHRWKSSKIYNVASVFQSDSYSESKTGQMSPKSHCTNRSRHEKFKEEEVKGRCLMKTNQLGTRIHPWKSQCYQHQFWFISSQFSGQMLDSSGKCFALRRLLPAFVLWQRNAAQGESFFFSFKKMTLHGSVFKWTDHRSQRKWPPVLLTENKCPVRVLIQEEPPFPHSSRWTSGFHRPDPQKCFE